LFCNFNLRKRMKFFKNACAIVSKNLFLKISSVKFTKKLA